jgi:type I restriction enzyme S subunit
MTASFESHRSRWREAHLGDIAEVVGGKPAPQDPVAFVESGIPFVRMKDLGRYHLTTNLSEVDDHINPKFAESKGLKPLKSGAILMPRSGSVALNHRAILGVDAIIVSHICALVPDSSKVFNKYLYYYLCTVTLEKITKKTTGLDAITFSDLRKLLIPLPPLDEQHRIAAILDKADHIMRKRERAIAMADELVDSAFMKMFGNLFSNNKNWVSVLLGELMSSDPQNGLYRPAKDYGNGTRILRIDGFYDGYLRPEGKLKRLRIDPQTIEKYRLNDDDIVINRVNSRSFLGKSALVEELTENTVFESNMMRFSVNANRVNPRFLVDQLQSQFIKQQILKCAKDAVNQSSINQTDVKSIHIRLPPIDLQRRYADLVSRQVKLQRRLEMGSGSSFNLFAALTQRAFLGEL